ncbi:hypothetical protein GOB93_03205 [Acetobacter musti]|uniref:Uncharacterized protein n=1 Tax=Acetobacter musti TaxID=864732 RepID=A0ABX0JNL2_9PROT|nr:hypothetical protein [Acetobacter musti]NHN83647.1 hypothetical protein [Acetobacter musti]
MVESQTERQFGEKVRRKPYSIRRRELDVGALIASSRIRPDMTGQVRTSGGMTLISTSAMKAPVGFWYVG